MQKYKFLLYFIAILLKTVNSIVDINSVNCDYNSKMCSGGYCNLVSRGNFKYINAGCFFFRPLNELQISFTMLRKNNKYFQSIEKPYTENLCRLEDSKAENFFFRRIISLTAKDISIIKCPLKGNITLKRIPCFMHFTQGFFPNGEYKLNVITKSKQDYLVKMNLSFVISK